MRVAYFTAGNVGAGHLVRGVAIGRGLARRGFSGTYRMFGPALPYPAAEHEQTTVPISEIELRDQMRAPQSELAATLTAFAPDLLVVDMFWAPLRHILPLPGCECWLLVRTCPRVWFVGLPDTPFAAGQYKRIVGIEPFRHSAIRESIDPVVVCNPDECRPPNALRERLGIPDGQPLVAVTHAGCPGEIEQLAKVAGNVAVVRMDLYGADALFPLAEWLPGADRIFSAAGYNSFWEAQWLGYADRTRFTAMPRKIDDQAWRLQSFGHRPLAANGADTLAAWIAAA
jgi:hypothetical protein